MRASGIKHEASCSEGSRVLLRNTEDSFIQRLQGSEHLPSILKKSKLFKSHFLQRNGWVGGGTARKVCTNFSFNAQEHPFRPSLQKCFRTAPDGAVSPCISLSKNWMVWFLFSSFKSTLKSATFTFFHANEWPHFSAADRLARGSGSYLSARCAESWKLSAACWATWHLPDSQITHSALTRVDVSQI